MWRSFFRTKPIEGLGDTKEELLRCLTAWDLTLFGIGAVIGAGVFVITGVAAATAAGPAIVLSFIFAGIASLFAALAYAELASSIGGCGSAYSYSYAGFGELIAWIIGWNLLLEYALGVSTVAIGWSGYVNNVLQAMGIHLHPALIKSPFAGGRVDLLAVMIVMLLCGLLAMGVKHTARFNSVVVLIKLVAIWAFIAIAAFNVNVENWYDFMPFGWQGVMTGASLVFFAYIGFDAISTAVEETVNPQRNVPIGIIASLTICTVIYIAASFLLTGIVPYTTLNVESPIADSLLKIGYPIAAGIIGAGAIAGLTTVMLVLYYGATRIFLAIARDGLIPQFFAKVNPNTKTPVRIIVACGLVMAPVAGLLPIDRAAELVNIGTLTAFVFVCAGVIYLRIKFPNLARPFKLPFYPIFPLLGVFCCLFLMLNLPAVTWWRFLIWTVIGLVVYLFYGRKHSLLQGAK